MTGAQIGTVFHRMMRMMDLGALRGTANLEEEIARQMKEMLEFGVVTQREYDAVPAYMLLRFFVSPLGVRLLGSSRVEREWAFTYRRKTETGEEQLVQGVIDCCFEERGHWILVDYKTDSAADIASVLDKHRPQIDLYAKALETITGVGVKERILYLVRAGRSFAV